MPASGFRLSRFRSITSCASDPSHQAISPLFVFPADKVYAPDHGTLIFCRHITYIRRNSVATMQTWGQNLKCSTQIITMDLPLFEMQRHQGIRRTIKGRNTNIHDREFIRPIHTWSLSWASQVKMSIDSKHQGHCLVESMARTVGHLHSDTESHPRDNENYTDMLWIVQELMLEVQIHRFPLLMYRICDSRWHQTDPS